MSFLNSRKVSWIIFGITLLTAVVSLFFLPDIIPVHFGILGTPDGWDYKMGILLFPILQFFLLFLTGRKKVKDFMFRFARTPLNSISETDLPLGVFFIALDLFSWAVDGLLLFIFFVEIWIITEAFRYR